MRVWRRPGLAGVTVMGTAVLVWVARARAALVRAALIRVATFVEDGVRVLQIALLRLFRRSTAPLLIPFVGHGSPQRVEIGARAVLGRPEARARTVQVPDDGVLAPVREPGQAPARRSRRSTLRSSLARFLSVEVADAAVTARTPGATVTGRSDRDGYVDVVLTDPGLSPGWHDVELSLADGTTVQTPVLVVSPDVSLGLVSDVDDTILETGLTRGLEFLRITLLTEVTDRAPLPGAAALYRALVCRSGEAGLPVFYLSTSPWNLHEMLLQFVTMRGFPLGPLLLTDWGPSHAGLFRIGAQAHKIGLVRRLLQEHPKLKLVLIGDSGQEDPEIYATIARESPTRVAAIYIRHTTGVDLGRNAQVDALAAEITAFGVPMFAADDSEQIAAHAVGIGLLDAVAVAAVRAELGSH
jgi:phosphatidate phosphatase APP1